MTRFSASFCVVALLGLLTAAGTAHADFSAAAVYRSASPAVVVIFGFDAAGNGSSGTGSIVTADGKILTNHHVIYDPKTRSPFANIKVYLKPSRITGDFQQDLKNPYSVEVIGRDKDLDLAVLQVVGAPRGLPVLPMGDSETVEIGASVAAIGHPGGGGLWTLTTGTVSSSRKDGSRDIFQTDAAINPGNSGGPLLDENSHLIGVNTFVRRVNAQGLPLEGLNYSLRSRVASEWLAANGIRIAFARPVQQTQPAAPSAPLPLSIPSTPSTSSTPDPSESSEQDGRSARAPEGQAMPPAPPAASFQAEPPPTRPRPQVRIDPESGPAQSAPGMPPAPFGPSGPSRARDDEPRVFRGPNGQMMYGVPDRDFDLKGASKMVFEKARKNARDAFDSLDAEFE